MADDKAKSDDKVEEAPTPPQPKKMSKAFDSESIHGGTERHKKQPEPAPAEPVAPDPPPPKPLKKGG